MSYVEPSSITESYFKSCFHYRSTHFKVNRNYCLSHKNLLKCILKEMLPSAEMKPLPLEVLELKFAEGCQVNPGQNGSVFVQSFCSPTQHALLEMGYPDKQNHNFA